jgi:ubiquitin
MNFGGAAGGQAAGMPFPMPTQPQPAEPEDGRPPEERYAVQLAALNEMGFWDIEENIRTLRICGGNVNAAVERLLNNPGNQGPQ